MGAFEFRDSSNSNNFNTNSFGNNLKQPTHCIPSQNPLDPNRLREENLITMKIYDSCRSQDCLTIRQLGPARAAESVMMGQYTINEGDVITPPHDAASVSVDKLKIKKILIVDKEKNDFKKGYWDIELKFVFEYRVIFREADGCIIGSLKAHSIYNKKVTLFGSEGSDLFMATDMFRGEAENLLGSEPFVHVEAKAMVLESSIISRKHHDKCDDSRAVFHHHREVSVTIGLFYIVKLFRIVDLRVESRGFAIPKECENSVAVDPCDFFDGLAFPMDSFAPPQKTEFLAGVSSDIPPTLNNHNHGHNQNNNGFRDIRENKNSCC
ncbi:MAG: hypothetical protein FWF57_07530 [Defluviitaleaceae bacterium]|nr:hypothetical protein [Defluviitaleaceae bacterium]